MRVSLLNNNVEAILAFEPKLRSVWQVGESIRSEAHQIPDGDYRLIPLVKIGLAGLPSMFFVNTPLNP